MFIQRAIIAVWMAAVVTLVAGGMELYDARIPSGIGMVVVAAGLVGLAVFLRDRYG